MNAMPKKIGTTHSKRFGSASTEYFCVKFFFWSLNFVCFCELAVRACVCLRVFIKVNSFCQQKRFRGKHFFVAVVLGCKVTRGKVTYEMG